MSTLGSFSGILRPAMQASSSRLPLPAQHLASASFSTSSPAYRSRERLLRAKNKRDRNIALQAAKKAETSGPIDPVLGYAPPPPGTPNPWEGCRLNRILIRPENIYATPTPEYSSGASPVHYLPGLTAQDQDLLFGALPHTSVELRMKRKSVTSSQFGSSAAEPLEAEETKVEQMKRILDLRNANKQGIETYNRQRVIEEFGGEQKEGVGLNTGSSEVQAALLTQRIRSVAEHLMNNPKDNSNKRSLRSLVHQRQQVLRYFKRKQPRKYDQLLTDLGLESRAVEGEITM